MSETEIVFAVIAAVSIGLNVFQALVNQRLAMGLAASFPAPVGAIIEIAYKQQDTLLQALSEAAARTPSAWDNQAVDALKVVLGLPQVKNAIAEVVPPEK